MNANVAKTCMEQGVAVTYDGRRYHRINAIILRKYIATGRDHTRPARLYLELYDGFSHSVINVPIEDVDIFKAESEGKTNAADTIL